MAGEFLSEIFGQSGAVATNLSGLWYLVGAFILLFFILYLYSRGTSAENIALFILSFFLIVISEGLFGMPLLMVMIPIIMIGTFTAVYVYYWFNK